MNRETLILVADLYDQAIRLWEMSAAWDTAARVYEGLAELCDDLAEKNEMKNFASRRRARAARADQDARRCLDLVALQFQGARILN